MQRLVNRTAEYYWQELEFQSMVYDRTTFILANTFADGPFPSGVTFKGDFSIVNDSFNHLNMTLNKVELNFETFSGRKPKFSKQYWRYIFDHGEGTLRTLRIIKYQIEDFIIPNYLGAALTQEVRPLTEFKVVGCEVKEVKERAFKNFTQLEVLDLSDNHLTTLPENVFSRNVNLQKILLANNQISFLTKTIFDGLPNLLLINLRKNKLTAVPAIPRHTNRRFQPMVYLMADNSIHCRCSLIWVLHELTFHHNLEIEATCSDPTMVRGMPIIEGFTRMDKEACYRLIRKEDEAEGPAQLAGPSVPAGAVDKAQQQLQHANQPSPPSFAAPNANQSPARGLAAAAAATQAKSSADDPLASAVSQGQTAAVMAAAPAVAPASKLDKATDEKQSRPPAVYSDPDALERKHDQTEAIDQSRPMNTAMAAAAPHPNDGPSQAAAVSQPASQSVLSSLLTAKSGAGEQSQAVEPAVPSSSLAAVSVNHAEAQSQAVAPQTTARASEAGSPAASS
jgi:Leucine-rich repeat (LRR) protein